MNLDDLPALLTVDETAELLRIGRRQCYAAIHADEIPSVRIGRSIRVPRPALLQMLGVQQPNGDGPDVSDVEAVEATSTATVTGLHDEA